MAITWHDVCSWFMRYYGLDLRRRVKSSDALGHKQFGQPIVRLPSIINHSQCDTSQIALSFHPPEKCLRQLLLIGRG
jgi:hypothetical protein